MHDDEQIESGTVEKMPWVLIPMAGHGQRFLDEGYTCDKPLIEAGGQRLLEWALQPIPVAWRPQILPIVRSEQTQLRNELYYWFWGTSTRLPDYAPFADPVVLSGSTPGAACTVLAAAVGLPPNDPVLVMNADQWFRCDLQATHEWAMKERLDGFVLTFSGTGPAWSYAITNGTDRILHVIEKRQVSPHATVGVYWWRRASDLVRSICAMIVAGTKTKGEYYLAPSLGFLPLSEKDVRIVPVEEFYGLGTPEQVTAFETKLAEGWRP